MTIPTLFLADFAQLGLSSIHGDYFQAGGLVLGYLFILPTS